MGQAVYQALRLSSEDDRQGHALKVLKSWWRTSGDKQRPFQTVLERGLM